MSNDARTRRVLTRALAPLAAIGCMLVPAAAQAGTTHSAAAAREHRGAVTHARSRPLAEAASAIATASAACAPATGAGVGPSGGQLRASALCFINHARRSVGLRRMRANRRLVIAATGQASDMIANRYFGHQRSGGPSLGARLRAAGYRGHTAGEAISYGCGRDATAQQTVQAWLNSPPHRAVLLGRRYTRAGVGVVAGAPGGCGSGAATWVLDAGGR